MSVIVNGDLDLQNFLRKITRGMIPLVVKPAATDYAQEVVNQMHSRQHRASGTMYRETKVQMLADGAAAVVNVSYGEEENRRPGNKRSKYGSGRGTPHRFVEPSMKAADPKLMDSLMRRLTALISS